MQDVPFEVGINAPAGLLNVGYGINDEVLDGLISCIDTDLWPLFPLDERHFQYRASHPIQSR
jgi:hypothetical protein